MKEDNINNLNNSNMSTMVSFSNQDLATKFLSESEIRQVCPLAFAETPTNKVSDKYVLSNTASVIADMEKLGWRVVEAKQRKSKSKSTRFSFHMIVFQNPDVKVVKTVVNSDGTRNEETDLYPRIILTNSHDGLNQFRLMCALFRLVCSNGLVIADDKFGEIKIRHINYTFEELQRNVNMFVEALPKKVELMTEMRNTILTDEQKKQLALGAFKLRRGLSLEDELVVDDETLEDILTPVRAADEGDDLWTVFNVVQEKMVKGGFQASLNGKKSRKVRKITGFVRDLFFNKSLWAFAESFKK